jgi:uncharacterized membrane protein
MESKRRSLTKAITWTVLDNIITMSIAYAFTSQVMLSFGIAIISNTIEILVYFAHERAWGRSK